MTRELKSAHHINESESLSSTCDPIQSSESGQSIVVVALVFIVLLAFVGLAVDAGFGFVRSSQFSAAVDAAALAGVVDLDPTTNDTDDADLRAAQFLAANGWPTSTLTAMSSARSVTDDGLPQYALTATWPVDVFFMRILGLGGYPITHPATAAFHAQAEMYTTSAKERGHLRQAAQFIYGPDGCTEQGDPVSPEQSTPGNPNLKRSLYEGVYRYRISVSNAYTSSNTLRIELFDPDSYNVLANDAWVTHSVSDGRAPESRNCHATSSGMGDSCIISTGESVDPDSISENPFWYQRVDENWDANCNLNPGNQYGDVVTTYELYYYDDDGDKHSLASYTVNNGRDYASTDLKWVSPGTASSPVPTDHGSFEVDLGSVPADGNGLRVIQMDVEATGGSAKNVWDIWAGPPPSYYSGLGIPVLSPDVNTRNLQFANSPALYHTKGVAVYALGRMPLSNYVSGSQTRIPLAPIENILGGGTIYVTGFDFDASAPPPPTYYTIDTVSESDFKMYASVVVSPTTGHIGSPGDPLQTACDNGTDCNNSWTVPQLTLGIPDVFFFGGTLEANYDPAGDDHVWSISLTAGRPILTE